jgi:simple sugar transport system ATP-binding protein
VRGVDLEVRAGEILGVAGVEGNGQPELAEALVGLRHADSGHISIADEEVAGRSIGQIRDLGVAYIPEDRRERGLVLEMSLWENSILGRQWRRTFVGRLGILLIEKIKTLARRLMDAFDVRARSISVEAATLSGGNQQKLILARELEQTPRLLIAHQPTRGLDVGAIEFEWKKILEQKAAGAAVLLISAELEEIYALSDRIVTLFEGRITGEYAPDVPAEELGMGMTGGVRSEAS